MSDSSNINSSETILIIGAGAAGLAAARVLHDRGQNVIVIEGRDRIGGRTHTLNVGGALVDQGASWVDGVQDNPLLAWVQAAGLPTVPMPYFDFERLQLYDGVLQEWLDPAAARGAFESRAKILDRLTTEQEDRPSASLAERMDRELEALAGSPDETRRLHSLLHFHDSTFAAPSEMLHPEAYAMTSGYAVGEAMIVGGYSRMINRLAQGLDIRLNEPAETIHNYADSVAVHTRRGEYRGSHVIVTVPLGVLKAGQIIFEPALPARKQAAIEAIGFGQLEKLFLVFDEPFWRVHPEQTQNVFYLSTELNEFPKMYDLSAAAGRPVLVLFQASERSRSLLDEPERMTRRALEILTELFPEGYRPPTATGVTNWQDDPFSRGSYSVNAIATRAEDYEILGEPIGERLLFAGESTSRIHTGYVGGAIQTGLREARRILGYDIEFRIPSKTGQKN